MLMRFQMESRIPLGMGKKDHLCHAMVKNFHIFCPFLEALWEA
jgi:hypothetical protein